MYAFVPGQAPTEMEVFKTLAHVESLWTILKNQDNYGPAQTLQAKQAAITTEQGILAFNGAVQAAVDKLQTLSQTRDASSTTGNRRTPSKSKPKGNCWDCNSPDHFKGDPSCPKRSGPSLPTHGLDADTAKHINDLCRAKYQSFSDPKIIPDGLEQSGQSLS